MAKNKNVDVDRPASQQARQDPSKKGWFSRRHQSGDANWKTWQYYNDSHRSSDVRLRQIEREERSAEEQLALLDIRLGTRVGAKKERARLEALVAAA